MPSLQASAATVNYTAFDIADSTPGQDLWRYDYLISGSFGAFDTLSLEYADSLYAQLALTTPPTTLDAAPVVTGGFPAGSPSLLQLTAFSANAALSDAASVTFVWLGLGKPGSQPFSVDTDLGVNLQTSRTTLTPAAGAVPEPASAGLVAAALAGLAITRRRASPAARR